MVALARASNQALTLSQVHRILTEFGYIYTEEEWNAQKVGIRKEVMRLMQVRLSLLISRSEGRDELTRVQEFEAEDERKSREEEEPQRKRVKVQQPGGDTGEVGRYRSGYNSG